MKRMKRGEKLKRESSPGVKSMKKTGSKKKKDSIKETKKTQLAARDKRLSLQSGINNLWLMMQRWMPLLQALLPQLSLVGAIIAAWPHSHLHWQGEKTCKIFSARKLGVNFSRNSSSSNEFIQYVDLSDFYEIWAKWSFDIGARKHVGLLKNSKYFYFDESLRVSQNRKFFY